MRGRSFRRIQKESGCHTANYFITVGLPHTRIKNRKKEGKEKQTSSSWGDFKSKKENKPTDQPKYRLNIY